MSFELLFVPEGYRTDVALVIAPYVDSKFMDVLVTRMKPQRLCLLVDDCIRPEDLQKIHERRRKGVKLEVRLARASGLMHMKAFYFEFVREEGPRRRKRRLLFGSANATDAAFHGRRNAELIADADLAIIEDSEIADYFSDVLSTFDTGASCVIDAVQVSFSNGLQPTVLYANTIVSESEAAGEMHSGVLSGFQASYEDCFFETENILYVLAGRGSRKSAELPAVFELSQHCGGEFRVDDGQ